MNIHIMLADKIGFTVPCFATKILIVKLKAHTG